MMDAFKIVDEYLINNKDKWIAQAKELAQMPEYGFCEFETSNYLKQKLKALGVKDIKETAITGFIVRLKGKKSLKTVSYIAELDGIYSPENPTANPKTGVSHACGHNIQTSTLLALAEAFISTNVMEELDGDVVLIAVPAEENTPTDILDKLKSEGKIKSDCGKHEMLRLGDFVNIDVVIGAHALEDFPEERNLVMVNSSCHGLKVIRYEFKGKAAHATVCPEKGINALNASVNTINGIQAIREYFDPSESVRVSYNIVEGGHNIGSVVDYSVLDVVVASKTMEGLRSVCERITQISNNAASTTGCEVSNRDISQYLPYEVNQVLADIIIENASCVVGKKASMRPHNYFSNDLGDVSQIIPTAQIVYGGFDGDLHSPEFKVIDENDAFINPARVTARTIIDLLSCGCQKIEKIIEN